MSNLASSIGSNALSGIIVIGFGAVVGGFWRWMRKHVAEPLKDVPIIKEDLADARSDVTIVMGQVSDLSQRFGPVEAQFEVNHGHSMRDSANRNEDLTRAVANKVGVDAEQVAPAVAPE